VLPTSTTKRAPNANNHSQYINNNNLTVPNATPTNPNTKLLPIYQQQPLPKYQQQQFNCAQCHTNKSQNQTAPNISTTMFSITTTPLPMNKN